MKRFAVVTDSTSNLTPDIAQAAGVAVIPCTIHWGSESYLDCVTLDAPTFYQWLQERKALPTTSQPSAGAFMAFFEYVAEAQQTDAILAVLVSSVLSGTYSSAVQAKAQLAEERPDLRVELVDSLSVSMGLGLQVLVAQRAADAGKSIEEAIAEVQHCYEASHILFAVDTLEFLHRGGRIGGAARLLGSALNLKPVLTFEDGRIEPLEKVRSRAKSLRRLIEIAEARLDGHPPTELALIHAQTGPDPDFDLFAEEVTARLTPERVHTCILTPVIGTHAGPGTIGIAFYTGGTGREPA